MTRKRLAPARWTLPDVVDPPDSVCFQINVPNDRFHIAAFLGAIYELSRPYKWQNDAAHTAILVGEVWLKIFLALRRDSCQRTPAGGVEIEDMSRFRIDPANNCILQIECAPDEWETFWDISTCVTGGAGQQGPGGPGPGPGESEDFCTVLPGQGKFILPIPVSEGDVITLSDLDGGWNDGTIDWFCATGLAYTFGDCGGALTYSGSDPLPSAAHMSIVALIDGVWYPTDTPIIIPAGATDVQVVFQANDDSLSDNSGTVNFCVKVENQTAETFTHHFDFTTGLHGWTIRTVGGVAPFPAYVAGVGIQQTNPAGVGGQGLFELGLNMPGSYTNLLVRLVATVQDNGGGVHGIYNMVAPLNWNTNIEGQTDNTVPNLDLTFQFAQIAQSVKLNADVAVPGDTHTITDCYITGPGVDPF